MEKHDTEKILKFLVAKDAFSFIINGLNSAILHLKIRHYCLTPASQTPVLDWWGDAYSHPLDPPLNIERSGFRMLSRHDFFFGMLSPVGLT